MLKKALRCASDFILSIRFWQYSLKVTSAAKKSSDSVPFQRCTLVVGDTVMLLYRGTMKRYVICTFAVETSESTKVNEEIDYEYENNSVCTLQGERHFPG